MNVFDNIQGVAHVVAESSRLKATTIGHIYDLEMIEAAAQGIVMENGLPNVKAVATAITDTNDNDGVAKYCERYFATLL